MQGVARAVEAYWRDNPAGPAQLKASGVINAE
jgi:hypothetical protein